MYALLKAIFKYNLFIYIYVVFLILTVWIAIIKIILFFAFCERIDLSTLSVAY